MKDWLKAIDAKEIIAWISTAVAVSIAISVTGSNMPLWFLLIPFLASL